MATPDIIKERKAHYSDDYFGKPRFRKFLHHLKPDAHILDLGSHSGVLLNFLTENGFSVVGVDRDPVNVAHCQRFGFTIIADDVFTVLEAPEQQQQYDAVFMSDFVEHFDCREVRKLLCLVANVLRPNGLIIVLLPNSRNLTMALGGFWEDDLEHTRPYPLSALKNELARHHMVTIEAGPDPDSNDTIYDSNPFRFLRNIVIMFAGRVLIGKDSRASNAYLIARLEEPPE